MASFILIAWSQRFRLMQPDSTFQRMVVAGHTNARSMFSWFLAEVYTYNMSQSLANLNASSFETILSCTRSHLLPINTSITSLLLLFFTSSTHRATFLKDSLRVMSKTTSAAAEERQQDRVMALNSSWPAVSHICSLMILLLSTMFRQANSIPTVYSWLGSNLFYMNLPMMLVLPTAVSPTRMNLNEQSKRLDKSIFIILNVKVLVQNNRMVIQKQIKTWLIRIQLIFSLAVVQNFNSSQQLMNTISLERLRALDGLTGKYMRDQLNEINHFLIRANAEELSQFEVTVQLYHGKDKQKLERCINLMKHQFPKYRLTNLYSHLDKLFYFKILQIVGVLAYYWNLFSGHITAISQKLKLKRITKSCRKYSIRELNINQRQNLLIIIYSKRTLHSLNLNNNNSNHYYHFKWMLQNWHFHQNVIRIQGGKNKN